MVTRSSRSKVKKENDRVKLVFLTTNMPINGISAWMTNYIPHLDKNKFDISIISGEPIDAIYEEFCRDEDIKLIKIGTHVSSTVRYYHNLYKILKESNIDIIHIHGNSSTISLELLIAFLCKIKIRIAHSHNTTCLHKIAHYILKPLFNCTYTNAFACGEKAGEWMFGKKSFRVIPNGFDKKKFKFSKKNRDEIREKLELNDKYILLHVGRFTYQKNHEFLLEIFKQVASKRKDAFLVLVGDGPRFDEIKKIIDTHQYSDRIVCYGTSSEIEKLYSAADIFVLPSRYEGLAFVAIEAQINGLRVITSNKVSEEVNIENRTVFLDLEDLSKWTETILSDKSVDRELFYDSKYDSFKSFDIISCANDLEKEYIRMYNRAYKQS